MIDNWWDHWPMLRGVKGWMVRENRVATAQGVLQTSDAPGTGKIGDQE